MRVIPVRRTSWRLFLRMVIGPIRGIRAEGLGRKVLIV